MGNVGVAKTTKTTWNTLIFNYSHKVRLVEVPINSKEIKMKSEELQNWFKDRIKEIYEDGDMPNNIFYDESTYNSYLNCNTQKMTENCNHHLCIHCQSGTMKRDAENLRSQLEIPHDWEARIATIYFSMDYLTSYSDDLNQVFIECGSFIEEFFTDVSPSQYSANYPKINFELDDSQPNIQVNIPIYAHSQEIDRLIQILQPHLEKISESYFPELEWNMFNKSLKGEQVLAKLKSGVNSLTHIENLQHSVSRDGNNEWLIYQLDQLSEYIEKFPEYLEFHFPILFINTPKLGV